MSDNPPPLADITVLELGHIVSGPFCSLLLSDLGAKIIKVEHPKGGDALRDSSKGGNSAFNAFNRNKKSITLNLKSDGGKEILENLLQETDVVVENFSPGAAERLGVGYEQLRELNPELIYCSIKGFNEGPYDQYPALDPVAEALSGLMSTTGYKDHPPARVGTHAADMVASFYGALGVLGALRQRDRDGVGQKITSPMFEGTTTLMGGLMSLTQAYDEIPDPLGGSGQSQWAPYDVYQTGDGEWVFVGPSSERHWKNLCEALELDIENDVRFDSLDKRRENREELDEIIGDRLDTFEKDDLVSLLRDHNVPVAPVNNTRDVITDPHLNATDALTEIRTIEGEQTNVKVPKGPLKSTYFESVEGADPPGLGDDTEAILRSMGYSEEEIETFRREEAI